MTQEPLNRVGEHFSKHWTKYLQGILVFIGGIIVRERGRIKGKNEGRVEQAEIDRKKMNDMHDKHEEDRKAWQQQRQDYENFVNEIVNDK